MVLQIRTLWLSAPLALVACGTGSSPATATDAGDAQTQLVDVAQGGPADSSSGSAPADGGAPGDATVATATISPPFFRGGVSVSFAALGAGVTSSGFTAYFEQVTDPGCVERQVGACSVFRCDRPADGGPPAIALESAGLLQLTSGDGGPLAEIGPDAGGVYYQGGILYGSIATGDVLTVTALGGDVPAFTAHLPFPAQIQLADASTTIPLAQGYGITWTGTGAWMLRVDLQEETTDRDVRVVCDFPGDAGSAVVPPAALSDLEVATFSATGNHADMEVFAAAITQVDAGGYPVTVVTRQGGGISALPRFQ